jgi:hypothetical protein
VTAGTLVKPDPPAETPIALTPTLVVPTAPPEPLPEKLTEGMLV